MKESHRTKMNGMPVLWDACSIIVAYLLSYYIRFYSPFVTEMPGNFYPLRSYLDLLVYLLPVYLLINYILRLYTPKSGMPLWHETFHLVLSNMLGMAFFILILFFMKEYNISRRFLILFFIVNIALGVGTRMLLQVRKTSEKSTLE